MIRTIGKLTVIGLAAVLLAGTQVSAQTPPATPTPATPSATPPATAKPKLTQFRAKISKLDKKEKTITVENKTVKERTFTVTSETKIMKDKKPATFDDLAVGDGITGAYTEADGKMSLRTVTVQPVKPAPAAPAATTPATPTPAAPK